MSPSGFDCSGLVAYAYAQIGVRSRTMRRRSTATACRSRDQLQPADLVFFNGLGHMGMYIGGGQFVHAPSPGRRQDLEPLRSPMRVDLGRRAQNPLARAQDPGTGSRDGRKAHARPRLPGSCGDEYGRSTSDWKFSITARRRSFSVGVTSPCSIAKSRGRTMKRFTCSKRRRSRFTSSTVDCRSSARAGRASVATSPSTPAWPPSARSPPSRGSGARRTAVGPRPRAPGRRTSTS